MKYFEAVLFKAHYTPAIQLSFVNLQCEFLILVLLWTEEFLTNEMQVGGMTLWLHGDKIILTYQTRYFFQRHFGISRYITFERNAVLNCSLLIKFVLVHLCWLLKALCTFNFLFCSCNFFT
jgi:hypothetical protein